MSNDKKQSSVEWFGGELDRLFINYQKGDMSASKYILGKYKLQEQAKAMHEEQIKQAYADGFVENVDDEFINEHPTLKPRTAQEYYNETFNP